jgi:predicted nucleic acid-binding protein
LKSAVLDSFALLAFLFKESGCEKVVDLIEKAAESDKRLLIAAPNWAEVHYQVVRKTGTAKWREVRGKLLGLPIEIVPVGMELAEMAGEIKAIHKMSLADCFASALAKQQRVDLCTGDPEFHSIEDEIGIVWI